jgi:integral membrane sensor domain MASE1
MRTVLYCLGAALAYFLAVRLGYDWMIPPGIVTLWPPSGVLLAALVLAGQRSWPPILVGALVGSLRLTQCRVSRRMSP